MIPRLDGRTTGSQPGTSGAPGPVHGSQTSLDIAFIGTTRDRLDAMQAAVLPGFPPRLAPRRRSRGGVGITRRTGSPERPWPAPASAERDGDERGVERH